MKVDFIINFICWPFWFLLNCGSDCIWRTPLSKGKQNRTCLVLGEEKFMESCLLSAVAKALPQGTTSDAWDYELLRSPNSRLQQNSNECPSECRTELSLLTELQRTRVSEGPFVVHRPPSAGRGIGQKLTSLSALIGQGLHGSAPSGRGFSHAGRPSPPRVTALAKKELLKEDFASEKRVSADNGWTVVRCGQRTEGCKR